VSAVDAGAPSGCMNYWKSAYLDRLTDAAIETITEHACGMGRRSRKCMCITWEVRSRACLQTRRRSRTGAPRSR